MFFDINYALCIMSVTKSRHLNTIITIFLRDQFVFKNIKHSFKPAQETEDLNDNGSLHEHVMICVPYAYHLEYHKYIELLHAYLKYAFKIGQLCLRNVLLI
jgi:hypothetical protein